MICPAARAGQLPKVQDIVALRIISSPGRSLFPCQRALIIASVEDKSDERPATVNPGLPQDRLLPLPASGSIANAMKEELTEIVLTVLQRAPEWIRHDLGAKDASLRARAEEVLAAMVDAAIRERGLIS